MEYEVEYGSSEPVGFLNPKIYDSKGNEIEIPKCDQCGSCKSQLIGKTCFQWVCTVCM